MLRRAYNGLERTLGPTHDNTLFYRRNLVLTLAVQDKDVEAEAEAREIVKITRQIARSRATRLASRPTWRRLG